MLSFFRPLGLRRAWLFGLFASILSLVMGAIACSGSSTTTVFTTTGVLIRAETLTTGRGCGRDPANVFKYAVFVWGYGSGDPNLFESYTQLQTSNLFDCFTDGAFIELPAVNGSQSYRLDVYAYNEPAYTAAKAAIDSAGDNPSLLEATTSPTWTTTCTATQQSDVQSLAVCDPLAPGLGGLGKAVRPTTVRLSTKTFHLTSGRVATCGVGADAGVDAGPDADAGTPTDAGADGSLVDGGVTDAGGSGSEVSFATVRVRLRSGNLVFPATDVPCPSDYVAEVSGEPARYEVDVGVILSTGEAGGETACGVTTQPGQEAVVLCP